MTKETPVLFSTPMVKAIDENRKKMTRRIIKFPVNWNQSDENWDWAYISEHYPKFVCPYGRVGDILWVKETFYAYGYWSKVIIDGKATRRFNEVGEEIGCRYQYHADWQPNPEGNLGPLGWHKRPSLFMPKEAARLFLKISAIRVERLQDITEEDAIAEGIEQQFNHLSQEWRYKDYANVKSDWISPIDSFQSLWASINGFESWDLNPWVWVIEFEKCKINHDRL